MKIAREEEAERYLNDVTTVMRAKKCEKLGTTGVPDCVSKAFP